MFITVIIGILALIALGAFLASFRVPAEITVNKGRYNERTIPGPRGVVRLVSAGALILAIIVTGLTSFTIVKPREVGVKVALGKPTAVVDNGFHVKAPWESVEKLDGAVQNDVYSGDSSIPVRLGNNGTATVDASIQWQLKTDDAMQVFLDYKTFEGIQSNLVDRNFRAALNEVMAEYDPLTSTEETDLATLSEAVRTKMQERVGDQIDVRSVTLPIINFDEATQARINELQSETAKTRVAEQRKETSTAEAEANRILVESITPETLTSKCLDIVAENGQSPIGCFPSGNGVQPVTMVGQNGEQK